jgi:endoglucanase
MALGGAAAARGGAAALGAGVARSGILMRVMRIASLLLFLSISAFAQQNQLAFERASHLQHGINASEWFAQSVNGDYSAQHLNTHTTAADIALIKSAGFDHVRLSINPAPLFREWDPERLPAEYLAYLDDAVKMITDAKLAVILDIHPESDFKRKVMTDNHAADAFVAFWHALAAHYANSDPDRVFFEVMNEPEFEDPYRWNGLQSAAVAAIRAAAPRHTIILSGNRWSDLDQLMLVTPVADPNVIYNFHFYTPHTFTHQGATWGEPAWRPIHQLPYPGEPDSKATLPEQDLSHLEATRYLNEHWDAQHIEAEIAEAARWAEEHNVPLTCNEFGVYRAYSRPQDREAWLRGVRTSLERHHIGWTMWDYSGGFGVVTKQNGKAVLDDGTVAALGLRH